MSICRVLFVCLGNICRSPTAEGVFRKLVEQHDLTQQFEIDSAGTGDWHIGAPPHLNAQRVALRRGVDLSGLRARQVTPSDLVAFDYIIAMDQANYTALRQFSAAQYRHKIHRFLELCPALAQQEVPDPYFGDEQAYLQALDLIERSSHELLNYLRQ